jgi:hypothetical protein
VKVIKPKDSQSLQKAWRTAYKAAEENRLKVAHEGETPEKYDRAMLEADRQEEKYRKLRDKLLNRVLAKDQAA